MNLPQFQLVDVFSVKLILMNCVSSFVFLVVDHECYNVKEEVDVLWMACSLLRTHSRQYEYGSILLPVSIRRQKATYLHIQKDPWCYGEAKRQANECLSMNMSQSFLNYYPFLNKKISFELHGLTFSISPLFKQEQTF